MWACRFKMNQLFIIQQYLHENKSVYYILQVLLHKHEKSSQRDSKPGFLLCIKQLVNIINL